MELGQPYRAAGAFQSDSPEAFGVHSESAQEEAIASVLYDHGDPTDAEQLFLELVNRARSDPGAEAARLGIDLNAGLVAGTIADSPKQPLAPNRFLIDSAREHSAWMLETDTFSHTGEGGSSATPGPFVTGVVYEDLNENGFYDPGAGIGGITVTVTGSIYYAVTSASGGYAVPVDAAPANEQVRFAGPGWEELQGIALKSNRNLKVDLLFEASPLWYDSASDLGSGWRWLFYQKGSSNPRWFVNLITRQWETR